MIQLIINDILLENEFSLKNLIRKFFASTSVNSQLSSINMYISNRLIDWFRLLYMYIAKTKLIENPLQEYLTLKTFKEG